MTQDSYLALSGGVGGAKLVLGLHSRLAAGQLRVIANTGDDFEHLGLPISPDIDTLLYTLAGCANPATGWGMRDETWSFMARLEELGGPTWFRLGDRDLAMHMRRRELLRSHSLTAVTALLGQALGVQTPVLPMSDSPAPTVIHTASGTLAFQEYFVREQAAPAVTNITYPGDVVATGEVLSALSDPALRAIIITPSNPWLSIAPVLSIPAIKSSILNARAPVIGVSPLIGGRAVKGPTAKIMQELGIPQHTLAIAQHYAGLLDGLIIDSQDTDYQSAIESLGIEVRVTNTLMTKLEDKARVADAVLSLAAELGPRVQHG
ncbi:MAG: 2-phospho-L-lactate transferase [Gammaproteobacteria bacterium]|jgi:LPPG:FO 2-phospho-L-lactate transferase|nr:2-phospho-L-lactate transferase [Gammaproteobacteria bacterium]